jgi:TPR repeat protein
MPFYQMMTQTNKNRLFSPKDNGDEWYRKGLKHYGMKKYKSALPNFIEAAEKFSHAQAQLYLGSMYEFGEGIPQDYQQSLFWYKRAANNGVVTAQ